MRDEAERVSAERASNDTHRRAAMKKGDRHMRRRAKEVKEPPIYPPGEVYRRRALVFSFAGRWPVSRVQRLNAKGYEGCPTAPPMPPDGMSEIEISRIVKLLERAGWTLVRDSEGRLVPVRMI